MGNNGAHSARGPSLIAEPTKWTRPRRDWATTHGVRPRRVQVNDLGQEKQHFLLRKVAVDLSELEVARWSHEEAFTRLEAIRFADKGGVPFCPYCTTSESYRLTVTRPYRGKAVPPKPPERVTIYKCRAGSCRRQFSITTGTIFAGRKMAIRDILCAQIIFANAVSGEAALRMRRALGCSYKTAFVLEGKLREAIAKSRSTRKLSGIVEVDGTEFGNHRRKGRVKNKGSDTRVGKPSEKRVILGLRERRPDGESRITVLANEMHYRDGERDFIRDNVEYGTTMISDEAFTLGYIGPHLKVKHKAEYRTEKGVHTNGIEGLHARIKRAENGVYYRIVGDNLDLYGHEASWREDFRRKSNGEQWKMLVKATTQAPVSRRWSGYWQRWQGPDVRRRKRTVITSAAAPAT